MLAFQDEILSPQDLQKQKILSKIEENKIAVGIPETVFKGNLSTLHGKDDEVDPQISEMELKTINHNSWLLNAKDTFFP